jgi:hypothetical protein
MTLVFPQSFGISQLTFAQATYNGERWLRDNEEAGALRVESGDVRLRPRINSGSAWCC